jgi:hypothetical protein
LANVIDVALSFEKERRWASASAMRTALLTALSAYGPLDPASARAPYVSRRIEPSQVAAPTPTLVVGSPPSSEGEPILLLKPRKG